MSENDTTKNEVTNLIQNHDLLKELKELKELKTSRSRGCWSWVYAIILKPIARIVIGLPYIILVVVICLVQMGFNFEEFCITKNERIIKFPENTYINYYVRKIDSIEDMPDILNADLQDIKRIMSDRNLQTNMEYSLLRQNFHCVSHFHYVADNKTKDHLVYNYVMLNKKYLISNWISKTLRFLKYRIKPLNHICFDTVLQNKMISSSCSSDQLLRFFNPVIISGSQELINIVKSKNSNSIYKWPTNSPQLSTQRQYMIQVRATQVTVLENGRFIIDPNVIYTLQGELALAMLEYLNDIQDFLLG